MEVKTIAMLLKGTLPRLRTFEKDLDEYEKVNKYTPIHNIVDKSTYVGIECEIENVLRKKASIYWSDINDGSLRNNGREFITHPIRAHRVEQALTELFYTVLAPTYEYTERCSTHIHVNVRTLTLDQLKSLILVYMIFEKALFNWVRNNREGNIFCVPLYDITFTKGLFHQVDCLSFNWTKYTALNLLPITAKGTVEFRHLHGTNDIKTIITWINFLLALKKFALKTNLPYVIKRISELNTNSEYHIFRNEVFAELSDELDYLKFEKDMSHLVTKVKMDVLEEERFINKTHLQEFLKQHKSYKLNQQQDNTLIDAGPFRLNDTTLTGLMTAFTTNIRGA